MKYLFRVIIVYFIILGSISAQKYVGKMNPLNTIQSIENSKKNNDIKILAVMVEFLEDNDGATFGNGTFGTIYSEDYGKDIIDPLPHNAKYFENHLLFAKNYYAKVSNGKVTVNYTVLPTVIKVSKKMRDYSPERNSKDFLLLGDFSKEVWELAAAQNPDLNFSDYNLFSIFHAGVGRDVSLPGSLGNERDLPSVYLSLNSLKQIYGADFVGFSANNSLIQNTMILPETESREISGITGTVLLELSINGLIVSSIASHIGLPDLFDTETGLSAIGRFGLMDGQAIFAYSGLFPPEPSAWEKIYLGWETPVTLNQTGVYNLDIISRLAANITDNKIYKIPINSSEYYLVENRQRDANNDGITLWIADSNQVLTKNFIKDTTGFSSYSVDSLHGVITDVDEFDWAVPGSGIVIWHIDELVINEKIISNTINNDKTRRGVDVEEADGIQDIGEEFTTIFGDIVIGEGEPEDLWYFGNEAKLYKNIFNDTTLPNTKSNTGASSLISFEGFSGNANKMSFRLSLGSENISIVDNLVLEAGDWQDIYEHYGSYYGIKDNNLVIRRSGDTNFYLKKGNFSNGKVITGFDNYYFAGVFNSIVNVYSVSEDTVYSVDLGEEITTAPMFFYAGNKVVKVGTISGKIYNINLMAGNVINNGEILSQEPQLPLVQLINDGFNFAIATTKIYGGTGTTINYDLTGGAKFKQGVAVLKPLDGAVGYQIILLDDQNNFYVFESNTLKNSFLVNTSIGIQSFIATDLFHNGEHQIVFSDGSNIWAYELSGAVADGFPIKAKGEEVFSNQILAADIDGNGFNEIIYFNKDGNIFAYNAKNKGLLSEFPISVGNEIVGNPYLIYNNSILLNVRTKNNNYYSFELDYSTNSASISYNGLYGQLSNNAVLRYPETENKIMEYFPQNRVYNWPNPVYDNQTYIRCYVAEDSKINVMIFDLAGDLVGELNGTALGGLDNELIWDVTNIQSGVYFARVEATGNSGQNSFKIIKIAVIK